MIEVVDDKCDFCGACVAVCPVDAIDLYETRIIINRNCIDCDLCVWICPIEALVVNNQTGETTCESSMTVLS